MTDVRATPSRTRENTRSRLLEAAHELFADIGMDATSVEAVCERAGFTRGAFYSNFESKDELFLALVRGVSESKLTAITERVEALTADRSDAATPAEIVQQLVEMSLDTRQGVLLMSEIRMRAMRDRRMAQAYRTWHEGMIGRVAGIVDRLVHRYGLRLRMPAVEFAQVMLDLWESTAAAAVISGLDERASAALAARRTQMLAGAVVEGF